MLSDALSYVFVMDEKGNYTKFRKEICANNLEFALENH